MTPTEIAHEVDRRLLPQRIEPIGMAAMKLHVPISAIRYFQHIGWLPAEFDLAFILELIHHPELEQWRKMLEARRNYKLLCMHDPSLSEDEALEIDIKTTPNCAHCSPPARSRNAILWATRTMSRTRYISHLSASPVRCPHECASSRIRPGIPDMPERD